MPIRSTRNIHCTFHHTKSASKAIKNDVPFKIKKRRHFAHVEKSNNNNNDNNINIKTTAFHSFFFFTK